MNLSTIPKNTKWGDAATTVDDNFRAVGVNNTQLEVKITEVAKKKDHERGYYSTLAKFDEDVLSGKTHPAISGDSIELGETNTIWEYNNDKWTDTDKPIPESVVELNEYAKNGGSNKSLQQVDYDAQGILSSIRTQGKNLINKFALVKGKYIVYDENTAYAIADHPNSAIVYIPIERIDHLVLSNIYRDTTHAMLFLDAQSNPLGGIAPNWGTSNKKFKPHIQTKMLALTVYYNVIDESERVNYYNKLQLEYGEVATPYEQYMQYRDLYTQKQVDESIFQGYFKGYYNTGTGLKVVDREYITIDKVIVSAGQNISLVNQSKYTCSSVFFSNFKNDESFVSAEYSLSTIAKEEVKKISVSFKLRDENNNIVLDPKIEDIRGLIFLDGVDTIRSLSSNVKLSFKNEDSVRQNYRAGYYNLSTGVFIPSLSAICTDKQKYVNGKIPLLYIDNTTNDSISSIFISYFSANNAFLGYQYINKISGGKLNKENAEFFTISALLKDVLYKDILHRVRLLGVNNLITKYDLNPCWGNPVSYTLIDVGDSLMAGQRSGEDLTYQGYGYYIARDNNMVHQSYAIGGAILSNIEIDRMSIYKKIVVDKIYQGSKYFIFNGGINDMFELGRTSIGDITVGYDDEYDTTTMLGALEAICKELKENAMPLGIKVGYILNHKVSSDFALYYDKIREVLYKWNIPFIDLWNNGSINLKLAKHREIYGFIHGNGTQDGTHLAPIGYQELAQMNNAWVRSL